MGNFSEFQMLPKNQQYNKHNWSMLTEKYSNFTSYIQKYSNFTPKSFTYFLTSFIFQTGLKA